MSDSPLPFVSRDALKAAAEQKTRTIEPIDLPRFGRVGILGLTGAELDDLFAWVNRVNKARKKQPSASKKGLGFRAFVLARTLVDAQGTRLLQDSDATDGWLDDLPADVLSPAIKAAFRLNGIGKQDQTETDDEDEDQEPAAAAVH